LEQNIDGALGFLLNKGTQALHRQLNRNFSHNGFEITNEQWSILVYLFHCDGHGQHEIAEKTLRDKVSVTKIIDNLEKRDLVYRVQDDKDRRIKRIFLTNSGRELVPELRKIAFKTIKKGFANVSDDDLESFKRVLSEIVKNLTGEDLLKFIRINKGRWK
jgi:DNA-binding MarR family transcriptional regulator